MGRAKVGVLGTFAGVPFAGMAWMHCQYLLGLASIGCDVFYVEVTSAWPYDPHRATTTSDPGFALDYLARTLDRFGFGERWMYRATYADGAWHGPLGRQAEELLRSADLVLNITGATTPEDIGVPCRLVHVGTDPVVQELRVANGDVELLQNLREHQAHFTYGENIATGECPVPALPFEMHPLRQPVALEQWANEAMPVRGYTTVTNWAVEGYDIEYEGELYTWSKHHEYLKILDLPLRRRSVEFELAMGLSGLSHEVLELLHTNGWRTEDAFGMSLSPWPYREYIRSSRAEFSVAKDMNVRLQSGWFSERSACYLAAGRPVICQDTGFGRVLPTGEGLFAFSSMDDILAAVDAIESDYERHHEAALAIANDYFRAETVLASMLNVLGVSHGR